MALGPSDLIIVSRGGVNYKAPVSQFDSRYQVAGENISASSINGGSIAGLRNRIINGNMIVDTRNAGLVYNIASLTAPYTLDRWLVYPISSTGTAQLIPHYGAPRQNLIRLTGAAGNTTLALAQRIESFNIADLAGRTVTVSFSTANSLRTSLAWQLTYPGSDDNYGSFTNSASGTITISPTITRYSFTTTLPSQASRGIQLQFSVANQTSGTWDTTDIQLEEGPIATTFERRPMQVEDILCKRYFQYVPVSLLSSANGAGQLIEAPVPFPVRMRITPSIGALQVDPSPGTAPQQLNLASVGVYRRTIDFAAPYIASVTSGLFYCVGYRYPLDSEI